ncbi:MAG: hypothetical protein ACU0CQ_10220 [Sulfitobacter sp.]|uniref:hypothetical protein n=1 Tax=Sulfitobacter sp. TaxID=1903071 RepID=UPI0040599BDA
MPRYEYKVVPAPTKGLKGKNVKGAEARFSHAIQELMNGLSGYGWEYLRAETLPSIERAGLTGTTKEWRNILVFRRLRETEAAAFQPELLPAPSDIPPEPAVTRREPPAPVRMATKAVAPFDGLFDDEHDDDNADDVDTPPQMLNALASRRKPGRTLSQDDSGASASPTPAEKPDTSEDPDTHR